MVNLVRDFQNNFGRDAANLDAAWRKNRDEIQADRNLSHTGRTAALAAADERRLIGVENLRARADRWAQVERGAALAKLAAGRAAAAKQRRGILGDSLTAELARRRLSLLHPHEMLAAVSAATDEWHRTLYTELADLELTERSHRGDHVASAALSEMGQSAPPEIGDLAGALRNFEQSSETLLADLDVAAYRQKMADVYGVIAEFVDPATSV